MNLRLNSKDGQFLKSMRIETPADATREPETEREQCLTCKGTKWDHSAEQWAYCQQKLAERLDHESEEPEEIPFDADAANAMIELHRRAERVLRARCVHLEAETLELNAINEHWIRQAHRSRNLCRCLWLMMGGFSLVILFLLAAAVVMQR